MPIIIIFKYFTLVELTNNVFVCVCFLAVAVAISVPHITPFLTIVGALFFSALGLIFPAIIETIVFWEEGFGFLKWKLFKNIFICIFGVLAMIFGTHSGIKSIINQ